MNWKHLKNLKNSPFPLEEFKIIQKPNTLLFYLFGGYSRLGIVNSDIFEFNLENLVWKKVENQQSKIELPKGRFGHSFDLIQQDKIYLFGGKSYWQNFDEIENILYEFDLNINKWSIVKNKSTSSPEERFYHASCGYNFGELSDFWKFDIKSQKWINIHDNMNQKPSARYHHQMFSNENKIYLIGGMFKDVPYKEVWEYDITLNKWCNIGLNSSFQEMIPMKNAGMFQMKEFSVLHGGITKMSRFSEYLNDLLIFDSKKKKFFSIENSDLKLNLYGHCIVGLKRTILIFGGNYGSIYNLVSYGETCLLDFGNDEIYQKLLSKSKEIEPSNSEKETIFLVNEQHSDDEEIIETEILLDDSSNKSIPKAPGPPLPPSKISKKKIKTKKFHCFPIPKNEFSNSIFNLKKISKNSQLIKLNENEICERFAVKPTKKLQSLESDTKNETISLISAKRTHSLAIQIKAIKLSIDEIIELILESSLEIDEDLLEILIGLSPTDEEIRVIKEYAGDILLLSLTDLYFYKIKSIPDIQERLKLWKYRKCFDNATENILRDISIINSTKKELTENPKFLTFLSIILAIGNYMNDTNSSGFHLNSLLKLNDTKTIDNKSTLLDYIIEIIELNYKEISNFNEELMNVKLAHESISYSFLIFKENIKELTESIRVLKRNYKYLLPQLEKQYNAQIPKDQFYHQMISENFIERANQVIKEIEEKFDEMYKNLELLSKLFNEKESTMKTNPEEFFQNLNQFLNLYEVIISKQIILNFLM
eukprot:gene7705-12171_t